MKGKHTMEEYEVISIPVSDGTERDFAIMDTFEFGGQGYLAVSLIEGDEIQEGVYIYRYHNAEDGDVVVCNCYGCASCIGQGRNGLTQRYILQILFQI